MSLCYCRRRCCRVGKLPTAETGISDASKQILVYEGCCWLKRVRSSFVTECEKDYECREFLVLKGSGFDHDQGYQCNLDGKKYDNVETLKLAELQLF